MGALTLTTHVVVIFDARRGHGIATGIKLTPALFVVLRRLHRAGLHLARVATCGGLAVLITLISWSHHGIWLPLLGLCAWRTRRVWASVVALVLAIDARWLTTTLGGPHWQHGWQTQLMATSFAALAAALPVAQAHRLRHHRSTPGLPPDPQPVPGPPGYLTTHPSDRHLDDPRSPHHLAAAD